MTLEVRIRGSGGSMSVSSCVSLGVTSALSCFSCTGTDDFQMVGVVGI